MEVRKATAEDILLIAKLVSESNKDVALKFGLNLENCLKHHPFVMKRASYPCHL